MMQGMDRTTGMKLENEIYMTSVQTLKLQYDNCPESQKINGHLFFAKIVFIVK